MTDTEALLVLNAIPGVGTAKLLGLLKRFGKPSSVFNASFASLKESSILPGGIIENLLHFPKEKFLESELKLVRAKGIEIVTYLDERYPRSLKNYTGMPCVLYVLGDVNLLNRQTIAIVGSRIAGPYGKRTAFDFSSDFARASLCVVSGLARGIDTSAHQGALSVDGKTVGVIGCGLSHVYPRENRRLYEEMSQKGAIVSEFPMSYAPIPANFPMRNRIISALSKAVVVIDAAEKSGALITADFALEQGKDVFAVPGPVDYETCKGSNHLIKEGAKVALSAQDVLEELGFDRASFSLKNKNCFKFALTPLEVCGYNIIESQPVHVDELAGRLNLDLQKTSALLVGLELKKAIKQLPGQYFVRA